MTSHPRVLVTGATGFIGSAVFPRLLPRASEVAVVIGTRRTSERDDVQIIDAEGPALVDEMNRLVYVALEDGCQPMEGAVELLTALKAAGVPVGLCSNSPRGFVDRAIAAADVAHFFDTIVTAEDVEHGKPAPDPYLEAARRLGADPANCVALEDSPPGAASAAAAGMTVYVVPSFEEADFAGAADSVFTSLADSRLLEAIGLSEVNQP